MTTTWAEFSPGLDLEGFGLDERALAALGAFAEDWAICLNQVVGDDPVEAAYQSFFEQSADLPRQLPDPAWQAAWLAQWLRAYRQGFPLSGLHLLFGQALELCHERLFAGPVMRLQKEIAATLRQAVFCCISGAMEAVDLVRTPGGGLPGELDALRFLGGMAQDQQATGLLSVALRNRDILAHLTPEESSLLPRLFAERLTGLLRPMDRLFYGQEAEWLLVMPDIHSQAQVTLAGVRIGQRFHEPLSFGGGRHLALQLEIGAAQFPESAHSGEGLVHAARMARHQTHRTGDLLEWFDPRQHTDWASRLQRATDLSKALAQDDLQLFLQPQVDGESGVCTGAEALLRWQCADGQWMAPPLIIEMIDEHGWRTSFFDWLLRSVLGLLNRLETAGIDIPVSINLTAADMLDADLPELMSQRLDAWGIAPERLVIELTESAALADPQRCRENMERLRQRGFGLALDDFGTGYSSLSHLANLPLNEIKIDRAFIVGMQHSTKGMMLVKAIFDIARDLDFSVVAEGVEDSATVAALCALGPVTIQGFLHAKALPVDDFIRWFQSRLSSPDSL